MLSRSTVLAILMVTCEGQAQWSNWCDWLVRPSSPASVLVELIAEVRAGKTQDDVFGLVCVCCIFHPCGINPWLLPFFSGLEEFAWGVDAWLVQKC